MRGFLSSCLSSVKNYVEDDDLWSEAEKAKVVDKFWKEYGEFFNHTGLFRPRNVWISAENPAMVSVSHEWHQNYSLPFTTYLGPLGRRVTSKGMGIGEAERH